MEILPIELFGVHIEVPFAKPVTYNAGGALTAFAARACDPQNGLAIRPEHMLLKKWDDLFGYELTATFFGDNGQLTYTPERAKIFVRNARTAADWNVIMQTLSRFFTMLDPSPQTISNLSAHVHARFPSLGERDEWLNQFSHNALTTKAGALGYVRIFDWEKDIRVLIEPSNVVPDSLFVAWDTQFPNDEPDWEAFLGTLMQMMENAANMFELGFEPLRERV
jgi:hypothetical protein